MQNFQYERETDHGYLAYHERQNNNSSKRSSSNRHPPYQTKNNTIEDTTYDES